MWNLGLKSTINVVLLTIAWVLSGNVLQAQVSTVEFGKNRVQFRNYKWQYLQSSNFNIYFYEEGKTIANYALQIAEKELPAIEQFAEYGLQRRANIVIYNHFNEFEQSNIGLSLDWQTTSGITKLVNNKMIVYFDGNHSHLRNQLRQGIARILLENILFGDDLGEFAVNKALLDLPKWLTDGYIDYVAEDWNTELDDRLRSELLSGKYRTFYQFAYAQPLLAGHAFWYYYAKKYKRENVTYFLYLARVYRNLNNASYRICKKSFKEVLKEFMMENETLYGEDLKGRKDVPKGSVMLAEELKNNQDYLRFTANPAKRSQTYAVVEYKKGKYSVVLYENMVDRKVLLSTGVRLLENEVNPSYPLLAWDGNGTRLACIYWSEGKVKLFVYDMVARYKKIKQDIPYFEQIQEMKFMQNENTLLLSAVRKGQSDIFTYNIAKNSFEQITNDVFADLDPCYVAFPNKQGILFASNRPSASAVSEDTTVPGNRFNIFLADNYNKTAFRQLSQLTHMRFGDARYPMPYNTNHFTFISDESGIANRFAGFFTSQRAGIDSVYIVGEEWLRNPTDRELDSTLKAWGKSEPDSVFAFMITSDSSYTFPITNYQSNLKETKLAGDQGQMSEVRQQGNLKFLYKLKVDEVALRKRNINPRATDYRKRTIAAARLEEAEEIHEKPLELPGRQQLENPQFESGFEKEQNELTDIRKSRMSEQDHMLKKARLFDYSLKFATDNFSAAFNNDVLINRYQPYTGSLPVNMQNAGLFNGMLKATVFDLFEDLRFTGGMRIPAIPSQSQSGNYAVGANPNSTFYPQTQGIFGRGSGEWIARLDYLKHKIDLSGIYYRQTTLGGVNGLENFVGLFDAKQYSNLYQIVAKYPFDKVRSLRLSAGFRYDKVVVLANANPIVVGGYTYPYYTVVEESLKSPTINKQQFALAHLEYVHDNSIAKTTNILNGLRFKVYTDLMSQINDPAPGTKGNKGRLSFNFGGDLRYYYPIYKNFIWAGRAAADFSWGDRKIVYYLGGVENWLFFNRNKKQYNEEPRPADPSYAYQSLAVNMRGFLQNASNGNNTVLLNSEFRFPVFATLLNRPINNAFLRNLQLVQFTDLGTAWNGTYNKIKRPQLVYVNEENNVSVLIKAPGIGPFIGGYGFGARSTLLGYFMRFDVAWPMNGFFKGKPITYLSMGIDF